MFYLLVNLWTKSYGTTLDKTVARAVPYVSQFRAMKIYMSSKQNSHPLPTPNSMFCFCQEPT